METIPQSVPMVQITNTNENKVDINISFSDVRKEIENMSALPDTEIEEILNKINELEKIVKSPDRKSKKWENAKGIVKWIADKGVDVGIALLPLLLQIKQIYIETQREECCKMGIKPLPHFENPLNTFAMQYKIKVQRNIETICLLSKKP